MEHRYLAILLILLAIAGGLYALSRMTAPEMVDTEQNLSEQIRVGEVPPPPMTDSIKAKVAASKGFAALASYTDRGFEPSLVVIKVGEAVRFTNNSSSTLWPVTSGEKVAAYPRTKQGCGSSDLDACGALEPQDFWEFTFEKAGTWEVVNNLDKSKGVFVRVE